MSNDLQDLERSLAKISPSGLSPDFLNRLDSAMSSWESAQKDSEDKVVPFPTQEQVADAKVSFFSRQSLGAVAAVAIFGAATALFVTRPEMTTTPMVETVAKASAPGNFSPEVKRSFMNVSGDKTYLNGGEQPVRQLSMDYMENVKLRDAEGRTIILTQPRRQTVVVPVQAD